MRLVPAVGVGEQPEVIKATVRLRTIPCVGRSNRRKTCLTLSPMQRSSFLTLARLRQISQRADLDSDVLKYRIVIAKNSRFIKTADGFKSIGSFI
jgi:hypothetical protein